MRVCLLVGSAETIACAATLLQKFQNKHVISSSPCTVTSGKPVLALAPYCQTPDRVLTRAPFFKSLASFDWACWLLACLTSQQHASVSQGQICSDKFTYCHTKREVANQTFYLTQSQHTDTTPTSPSTDPITPGSRYDSTRKNPHGPSGNRTPDLPLSRRMP